MLERCSLFIGVEFADRIIRAGASGDTLCVPVEGRVSIRIGESDETALAQHTEPGSFFGKIALVDSGPRSASVIAEADSTLLRLPLDVLEDGFRGNALMEARVMRNLATALSAYPRRANAERLRRAGLGAASSDRSGRRGERPRRRRRWGQAQRRRRGGCVASRCSA